jgi:hypothetical protein
VGFLNIRIKDTIRPASPNPEMEKKKLFEDFQAVSCSKNGGIASTVLYPVLRIRIHMFLGLLDLDPDPSIIKQK